VGGRQASGFAGLTVTARVICTEPQHYVPETRTPPSDVKLRVNIPTISAETYLGV